MPRLVRTSLKSGAVLKQNGKTRHRTAGRSGGTARFGSSLGQDAEGLTLCSSGGSSWSQGPMGLEVLWHSQGGSFSCTDPYGMGTAACLARGVFFPCFDVAKSWVTQLVQGGGRRWHSVTGSRLPSASSPPNGHKVTYALLWRPERRLGSLGQSPLSGKGWARLCCRHRAGGAWQGAAAAAPPRACSFPIGPRCPHQPMPQAVLGAAGGPQCSSWSEPTAAAERGAPAPRYVLVPISWLGPLEQTARAHVAPALLYPGLQLRSLG